MTSADLLKPSILKTFCARAGIRPDRKSGQNFLINRAALERIVAAVDPQPGDTILEVGAGFGVLTLALAERLVALAQQGSMAAGQQSGCFIAVERDRRIVPLLRELVMPYGNVEVVEGDILRILRAAGRAGSRAAGSMLRQRGSAALQLCCAAAGWKLAANLPYSITSDFLRLLFDVVGTGAIAPPERVVLLLQREVVDRLVADPSQPSHRRAVGLLTILTQLHCIPRRIAKISPSYFWPQPKVESAVVVLEGWRTPQEIEDRLRGESPPPHAPLSEPEAPSRRPPNGKGRNMRDDFLRLVRTAFGKRRGQLQRTLRSVTRDPSAALRMARIDSTARPEELTFEGWVALARAIHVSM